MYLESSVLEQVSSDAERVSAALEQASLDAQNFGSAWTYAEFGGGPEANRLFWHKKPTLEAGPDTAVEPTKWAEIKAARAEDIENSTHPRFTRDIARVALSTQLWGAARPGVLIGVDGTGLLLNLTHNALATGLGVGVASGVFTWLTAKVIDRAGIENPRAMHAIDKRFPKLTNAARGNLPGFEVTPVDDSELEQTSLVRRLGRDTLTHLARGVSALFVTTAGYPLAARAKGRPKEFVDKLVNRVGFDAGAVTGLFYTAIAELILKSSPQAASSMEGVLNDRLLTFTSVAGGLAVFGYLKNLRSGGVVETEEEKVLEVVGRLEPEQA